PQLLFDNGLFWDCPQRLANLFLQFTSGLVISGKQEYNSVILKNVYFTYEQYEALKNVGLCFENIRNYNW
ncbi:hypothetical protein, partial [Lentilactobacillus kefiri]|uniref:hypothetical protein n=1 Tax=Lentilactobacillus kefiri TaxID=33962 RepID=UPI0025A1A58B